MLWTYQRSQKYSHAKQIKNGHLHINFRKWVFAFKAILILILILPTDQSHLTYLWQNRRWRSLLLSMTRAVCPVPYSSGSGAGLPSAGPRGARLLLSRPEHHLPVPRRLGVCDGAVPAHSSAAGCCGTYGVLLVSILTWLPTMPGLARFTDHTLQKTGWILLDSRHLIGTICSENFWAVG